MLRSLAVLSLATATLALPSPATNPSVSLVNAFRSIRRDALLAGRAQLVKRQLDLSDLDLTEEDQRALSGLQDLLQKAVDATLSGGECSNECGNYAEIIADCTAGSSYTSIGLCACRSSTLSAMETCGTCFGNESREDATDFADYCTSYGATSNNGARSSSFVSSTPRSTSNSVSLSATAAGAPSASASAYNTASRAAGVAPSGTETKDPFGGLNDIGTATTAGEQPTASGSLPSGKQGGGNGVGVVTVGASLLAGAAGGAAALLVF